MRNLEIKAYRQPYFKAHYYDATLKNEILYLKNIITDNKLALENYFGTAQNIEGGIKGDAIYFWQTRNIVKKFKGKSF